MIKHVSPVLFTLALVLGVVMWAGVSIGSGLASDLLGLGIALVLLVIGADFMVHGAVHLARRLGVSPFFIGVTVVAFGTSAPELAASVGASLNGSGGLAVGNVLGSNIANICLILGATALISPVPIERSVRRVDGPLMLVLTVLASLTMLDRFFPWGGDGDGFIGRIDAGLLLIGLAWYVWFNARSGRIDPEEIEHELEQDLEGQAGEPGAGGREPSVLRSVLLFVVGLIGLVLGADLLVENASSIAKDLGVSEAVIGLTLVAFGTSLPELVFSARAAMKGHSEIAIGNIIGSNVFNLLSVLGIAAMVRPIPVPAGAPDRDIWVVGAVTLLIVALMQTGSRISRPEGGVLLALYAVYTYWVYAG